MEDKEDKEVKEDKDKCFMSTISFKEIIAWQKAHKFVVSVYKETATYPEYEKFGLRSQFLRAAVSIPANIAEGYKKISKADKLRFLNISQGSLEECRYYVLLSKDLGYFSNDTYLQMNILLEEVSRFLNLYIKGIVNDRGPKSDMTF